MRAFFNEENPEFLQYIDNRYHTPISEHPLIFFCNAFALPCLFSKNKTRKKALIRLNEHWKNLPIAHQQDKLQNIMNQQKIVNDNWQARGFDNEVNDDWEQQDISPVMK